MVSEVDWVAYEEMQRRLADSTHYVDVERHEKGLNQLLKGGPRRSSGEQLANGVSGSARKDVVNRMKMQKPFDEKAESSPAPEQACQLETEEAFSTIVDAVSSMSGRQAIALADRLDGVSNSKVAARLGVTSRQVRNYVASAAEQLEGNPDFVLAVESLEATPSVVLDALKVGLDDLRKAVA